MSGTHAERSTDAASGPDRLPDPEPPQALDDLLDAHSRRLLVDAARDLGFAVHLVDAEGEVILGEGVPPSVAEAAISRETWAVGECGAGADPRRYLVRAVGAEAEAPRAIGVIALGPYAGAAGEEPPSEVRRISSYLGHLVDHLVAAGYERLATRRYHTASIESAYEELQHKNARLAAAVERLQELDKVKSNFLATVSHELRTPLTSVIGYSEMLLEDLAGPLNDEQREYVRTVMEKGEQLLTIITGILDLSRIEAGGVRLDRSRFAVEPVIDAAISTLMPTVRRKKMMVRKQLAGALPPVFGDRDKVRQVLINLIGNAVKFSPECGEVVVSVEPAQLRRLGPCDAAAAGGGSPVEHTALRVAITDAGIGIPCEALGKIFEPFFQVDSSSTRQYGGTGLGLAIVKSFVHAHGGSVWAESTPGRGSRFFVTLPIAG